MKFNYCIGNPPYQEETAGESHTNTSVYNYLMDSAFEIAEKSCFITPARFLMNAGNTPKAWNMKMLSDPHLKTLWYERDSGKVFPGMEIPGGMAVTYHDNNQIFGEIGVFIPFNELINIRAKVEKAVNNLSICSVIFQQNRYNLDALYNDYPEAKKNISSEGRERRIVSTGLDKIQAFTKDKQSDEDVRILGIVERKRAYRWINSKYVEDNGNLDYYKVIVSMSNGASGNLGDEPARIISLPQIGYPKDGFSETFMSIGKFSTEKEAESALKYLKGKFARVMLGILKVTQHNTPEKWLYVPLQDFSSDSDIDWNQSISEIDKQLYKKYSLSQEEIDFIETHVKEMN